MPTILTLESKKYSIKIENFEGPLDLLIYLIEKNKMDIYDINLAEITDQYIEYLNKMEEMNLEKEMTVHCGKVTDSMEMLESLCREEAEKLLATLDVPEGRQVEVPFWTKDFPELIAVGKFSRDKSGKVIYELDFSQSTIFIGSC